MSSTNKAHSLLSRWRFFFCIAILAALWSINRMQTSCEALSQGTVPATVAITRTSSEAPVNSELEQAVRQAVALAGGLDGIISPTDKVMIQPNIVNTCCPSGSWLITDARVVRTIVTMVKERGVPAENICIAEGCATWRNNYAAERDQYYAEHGVWLDIRQMTRKAFHDSGYDADANMIDDATGVKLLDLNDCGQVFPDYPVYPNVADPNYVDPRIRKVQPSNYLVRSAYYFRKEFFDYNKLIRVPVLKNHETAGVTGAIKLALGSAPSDIYHQSGGSTFKWNLAHCYDGSVEKDINAKGLVDLNLCRKPDFVVVDGLRGITNGPVKPTPTYPNLPMRSVLAGKDPVAVDTITALLMGYDYLTVGVITYGADRGVGTCNPALITVKGTSVSDIRHEVRNGITRADFQPYGMAGNIEGQAPYLRDITVPANAKVFGAIEVAPIEAYDVGSAELCKAELYCDGVLKGVSINAPYNITFNGLDETEGTHELVYKLYDRALNEAVARKTVDVRHSTSIKDALSLPDGTDVAFGEMVVSGRAPQLGNTFFVQKSDRSGGIRCLWSGDTSLVVEPGDVVSMSASVMSVDGQKGLVCNGLCVLRKITPPQPVGMRNEMVGGQSLASGVPGVYNGKGLYNLGLFVRTWGKVTKLGTDYYYIDDGSGLKDGSGETGIKVVCGNEMSKPEIDTVVTVTGASITTLVSGEYVRAVAPRSSEDYRYVGSGSGPEPPEMLTPENVTNSEIEWKWTSVPGALLYRLEDRNHQVITEIEGTRFEERNLTAGTNYVRHVHAVTATSSSAGSIEKAQRTAPVPGTELVVNGGFENGFTSGIAASWSPWVGLNSSPIAFSDDTIYRYNGSHSHKWGRASSEPFQGGLYQVVDTIPGRRYTFSVQMSYDCPDPTAWLELGFDPTGQTLNGNAPTVRYGRPSNYAIRTWQPYVTNFVAAGPKTTIFLRFGHDQTNAGEYWAWMDGVSLKESTNGTTNICTNGDFENGFEAAGLASGWSAWSSSGSIAYSDNSDSHYGSHAQGIQSANGQAINGGIVQQMAVTPGDTYVIGVSLKHNCSDPSAVLQIGYDRTGQTSNGNASTVTYVDASADAKTGWTKRYIHVAATGSTMSIFIKFAHGSVSGNTPTAVVDDVYAIKGPAISNYINNGDFEKAYIGDLAEFWNKWRSSWSNSFIYGYSYANYKSGKYGIKFYSNGNASCNGGVNQAVTGLQPNHQYMLTGWTRRWTSATNPKVFAGFDPTGQVTNGDAVTIQWTEVTGPLTTYTYFAVPVTTGTSTTGSVWLRIWQTDQAGTGPTELLADDIKLGE